MDKSSLRFSFSCQRCGSVLEAFGSQCGKHGRCPTCGAVFTIPNLDSHTGLAAGAATVADDGQLPTPMHAYATAGGKAPQIKRLPNGEQVIICPRCGRDMPVDAHTCSTCGLPFTMEGAAAVAQGDEGENSMATVSLVAGVVSLLTFCFPLAGVAAIATGVVALKRARLSNAMSSGRSMAWAGIICGAISILGFVGWQFR